MSIFNTELFTPMLGSTSSFLLRGIQMTKKKIKCGLVASYKINAVNLWQILYVT